MSVIGHSALVGAAGNQGGYQISRSLRFRNSASAYLSRTPASNGNQTKWTVSFWYKPGRFASQQPIITSYTSVNNYALIGFSLNAFISASDTFKFYVASSGTTQVALETTAVYRDPSAWYHVVVAVDTTQATSTNRVLIYVNGVQVTSFSTATYPSLNASLVLLNTTNPQQIGALATGTYGYYDGYMAEFNWIDGQQLTPSSFGEADAVTGVWNPKRYSGTYGTNGFYLNFSDNSAATAAAIGKDSSGNGNNWTPNNISLTAGTTYDSMIDSPTNAAGTSTGIGNYAVLNPLQKVSGYAPDNGNLRSVMNATGAIFATIGVTTGKWYWENIYEVAPNGNMEYGVSLGTVSTSSQPGNVSGSWAYSPFNGSVFSQSGTPIATVATASLNDVIGLALDVDAGTLAIYKNNSLLYTITSISGGTLFPVIGGSSSINAQSSVNFGQRPFTYTPPTGYKALNTYNLPAPSIANGAQYMAATLYTGNGSTNNIVNSQNNGGNNALGKSFYADFAWAKARSVVQSHFLANSLTGTNKYLQTDTAGTETSLANSFTSFNSDGFTLGSSGAANGNTYTYVAWQWKAGAGTTSTNTSGSITSTVSVSAQSGFSIVSYTGTFAAATVGHGLGVAPSMMIVKTRTQASVDWAFYHVSLGNNFGLYINDGTIAKFSTTWWNNTTPTSSVFSVGGTAQSNGNAQSMIAYCFAPVSGYSAFGSYTGNGSADGPFVYTGFRPRYILIRNSAIASNWIIWDTSRNTYNLTTQQLFPNVADAEDSTGACDILSNGFKLRSTNSNWNGNGNSIIYAAFAENPFQISRAR